MSTEDTTYISGDVSRPKLADYGEKYKHVLALERENGILVARLHSHGGVMGTTGWFNVWHQAWWEIGNDPENEIIIITATGDRWINFRVPPDNGAYKSSAETYDLYLHCLKNVENVIFGLNVPTIGVIQAPAFVHYEAALFCDLTLCAEDAVFKDPHADFGLAPGDGLGLAFQYLMSPKNQAYYLYTSDAMDAETALRLGLVNEIQPVEKLMDRALEIARRIQRLPRVGRLMAKQIVRRRLQQHYVENGGFHLAHEVVGILADIPERTARTPERTRESLRSFEAKIRRRHPG